MRPFSAKPIMKISNYFTKSPVFNLITQGRELERTINHKLQILELSYFQALLLVALYTQEDEQMSMSKLMEVFPISKGAMSQALAIVESKQLIKRTNAPDRRVSWIMLTSRGVELAGQALNLIERFEKEFESHC